MCVGEVEGVEVADLLGKDEHVVIGHLHLVQHIVDLMLKPLVDEKVSALGAEGQKMVADLNFGDDVVRGVDFILAD